MARFEPDMDNKEIEAEAFDRLHDAIADDERSLASLNELGGMNCQQMYLLFNRKRYPNLTTFIRVCMALGKSPNDVLKWDAPTKAEVKQGKWVRSWLGYWTCSECGNRDYKAYAFDPKWGKIQQSDFCGLCGAQMTDEVSE